VTIRLDQATIAYFKKLAEESEIPYQTLINLYLRDCASSKRRLAMNWTPQGRRLGA
jgi:predicted DNA binding CopG/RHH family protein